MANIFFLGEIGFLFELKMGGFEVPIMGQILEREKTYQLNVKRI